MATTTRSLLLGTSSGRKNRKLGSRMLVYLLHFPIPGVMAASGVLQTVNIQAREEENDRKWRRDYGNGGLRREHGN